MRLRKIFVLVVLFGTHVATAIAFEATVSAPDFTVTVPALPSIELAEQPLPDGRASRQLSGSDGTYSVSLIVARAQKAITTRECAGSILRSLVARPGMPERDSIYRAALDEQTFLVIYLLGGKPTQVLHAHLLSSAASTHCIEAHFSRALRAGEDEDAWRRSFSGSRIVEGTRRP